MEAKKHPFEAARLAQLRAFEILDTDPEDDFDEIVKLAAALCDLPASTITFVDDSRQWFKARHGMPPETAPLKLALCAHTVLETDLLEIPDTLEDARTSDNPLCHSAPGCRFYAGVPLMSDGGLPIGTLCVLGFEPKTLTPLQRDTMKVLANHVMKLLELRKSLAYEEGLRHEVDHRVKNSLQTISSMTRLKKRKAEQEETKDALAGIESLIETTAALHALIYRSDKEGRVSLSELMNAAKILIEQTLPENILLSLSAENAIVPTATASGLLLVVNEFVANSIKHAFPNGRTGQITIRGTRTGDMSYKLNCADDGVGYPACGTETNTSGIGRRLIKSVAAKIHADVLEGSKQTEDATGAYLTMTFPMQD